MSSKQELAETIAKGFAGIVGAIEQLRIAVKESTDSTKHRTDLGFEKLHDHEQRLATLERKAAE